jgi:hydrogenase nickel incorporation protein HypA/HybF
VHETAIIGGLLRILDRQARAHGIARVTRVRLKVGRLRAVEPRQLQSGFAIFAEGSIAEGAELEIEEIPVRARCRACHAEFLVEQFRFTCAQCGGSDLEITAGQELFIDSFDGDDAPRAEDGRSPAAHA